MFVRIKYPNGQMEITEYFFPTSVKWIRKLKKTVINKCDDPERVISELLEMAKGLRADWPEPKTAAQRRDLDKLERDIKELESYE